MQDVKNVACADVLDESCTYVASGESEDEVSREFLNHVRSHHAHITDGKSAEEQRATVRSWIQTHVR